jgi:hypothetical protein
VKVGQRAAVTTDTYPGKRYKGHVSFISSEAEFTPKNVQTEKERVKLVYRIKIDIINPNMELKPGMPADAVIETGERGEGREERAKKHDFRTSEAERPHTGRTPTASSTLHFPRPSLLSPLSSLPSSLSCPPSKPTI